MGKRLSYDSVQQHRGRWSDEGVSVEKMCIHMDEDIWIENPLLGMSERTLSEKERYEMILNPGIFL